VMENGNLIGFDSHNNLLKNNQTYKDLFSAWNLVNDL
jgi:ABC-type multidrug transport system fused ATPase/permease subunit